MHLLRLHGLILIRETCRIGVVEPGGFFHQEKLNPSSGQDDDMSSIILRNVGGAKGFIRA